MRVKNILALSATLMLLFDVQGEEEDDDELNHPMIRSIKYKSDSSKTDMQFDLIEDGYFEV
jgi:hypothetical protein